MSRIFARFAISNLARLANSGASASLKSKGILRVACQGLMRCDSRLMSSMNKSNDDDFGKNAKDFVKFLEEEGMVDVPSMFEITRMENAEVELKGSYKDEEIKINFKGLSAFNLPENINKQNLNEIINLTVDFAENEKSLHIECNYDNNEVDINIKNLVIMQNGKKTFDGKDKVMSENLIESLQNMLEGRGIDTAFVSALEDMLSKNETK